MRRFAAQRWCALIWARPRPLHCTCVLPGSLGPAARQRRCRPRSPQAPGQRRVAAVLCAGDPDQRAHRLRGETRIRPARRLRHRAAGRELVVQTCMPTPATTATSRAGRIPAWTGSRRGARWCCGASTRMPTLPRCGPGAPAGRRLDRRRHRPHPGAAACGSAAVTAGRRAARRDADGGPAGTLSDHAPSTPWWPSDIADSCPWPAVDLPERRHNGPLPRAAAEAMRLELAASADQPRITRAAFDGMFAVRDRPGGARRSVAAPPEQVALTSSTTQGVGLVVAASMAAGRRGADDDGGASGAAQPAGGDSAAGTESRCESCRRRDRERDRPRTRMVAVSHVLWTTGACSTWRPCGCLPRARRDAAADGARRPVRSRSTPRPAAPILRLSGQKWLLGPQGSGGLWSRRATSTAWCRPSRAT